METSYSKEVTPEAPSQRDILHLIKLSVPWNGGMPKLTYSFYDMEHISNQ